ncbi:MAG: adenylyltransferase/cytidyltransferase family protein [Candidatus Nanohaloarchaeota archaeon]|nr:adenylyltransferase/cytidyltransferase family protein [Candidatus Nanohaloarchaeota archaeon]
MSEETFKFERCVAGGCFTIIHPGHIYFFKKAKLFCKKLYVIVAHDDVVIKKYGRVVVPQKDRILNVKSIKYVDGVFAGVAEKNYSSFIDKIKPTAWVVGYDQQPDKEIIEKYKLKVIKIAKYKDYSTKVMLSHEISTVDEV